MFPLLGLSTYSRRKPNVGWSMSHALLYACYTSFDSRYIILTYYKLAKTMIYESKILRHSAILRL